MGHWGSILFKPISTFKRTLERPKGRKSDGAKTAAASDPAGKSVLFSQADESTSDIKENAKKAKCLLASSSTFLSFSLSLLLFHYISLIRL